MPNAKASRQQIAEAIALFSYEMATPSGSSAKKGE